jgi:hypothetical protein
MTNIRRKKRYRAKREREALQAAPHTGRGLVMPNLTAFRLDPGYRWPRLSAPPVLDNFTLRHAAAGALTIGDPDHRPPAPIDFAPPATMH